VIATGLEQFIHTRITPKTVMFGYFLLLIKESIYDIPAQAVINLQIENKNSYRKPGKLQTVYLYHYVTHLKIYQVLQ
jgi:hypothetical protein